MTLRIGDRAPDFTADTTQGQIRFHQWIGNSWCVLYAHPKDFTPVGATEVVYGARLKPAFDRRNCRIIRLSADPIERRIRCARDIVAVHGYTPKYPMIDDTSLAVAKLFGMRPAEPGASRTPTAMNHAMVCNVFVIGPDKKIKLIIDYPMSIGRKFDTVLQAIESH